MTYYYLILSLLIFPHSLYLFPKHFFVSLETIPLSLSPSPVRHSFCNLDCPFHSHSLCPVSVIGNPISSLKPFLKRSSLISATALPTSSFHHSFPFLICPPTRFMPHTSLVHPITISELFPLLLHTLHLITSPYFIFSTQASDMPFLLLYYSVHSPSTISLYPLKIMDNFIFYNSKCVCK